MSYPIPISTFPDIQGTGISTLDYALNETES